MATGTTGLQPGDTSFLSPIHSEPRHVPGAMACRFQKVLVGAGECLVVTANPGWIRDQLTSSFHKYLLVDFANTPSTDTLNNYASKATQLKVRSSLSR